MNAKKPSQAEIKKQLKQLRKFIEDSEDMVATRIAYSVECAVKWATESTADWPPLLQSVKEDAKILRRELQDRIKVIIP